MRCLHSIIIDESHTCRGVFGSHVALVLRRLQRIVALYSDRPYPFLLATATISNVTEHAAALIGQAVTPITQSGAPRGERTIVLWQPPDYRSHSDEAVGLMAFFVSQGVRTLLFGQQCQSVERMALSVRERLPARLRNAVSPYRAGFLDRERKEIQRRLSTGELTGVVSTNALELGIDIGDLDVVILDGFPGSVASFWQQGGRARRSVDPALVILVLRQNALDQYFAAHPHHLFAATIERAIIDLDNPSILSAHLRCAACERRLSVQELSLFVPSAQAVTDDLVRQGYLTRMGALYVSQETRSLARSISLRNSAQQVHLFTGQGECIEEIGSDQAIAECYPGAIYLSQGVSFEVTKLDLDQRRVELRHCSVTYYTKPFGSKEITFLDAAPMQRPLPHAMLSTGRVHITDHISGYGQFHQRTHVKLAKRELAQPLTAELETQACWLAIDSKIDERLTQQGHITLACLHAAEHSMIALLPLYALCDPRDMAGVSVALHPQVGKPLLCIYDGYQGGVGYARLAYEQFSALAAAALDHLKRCPCLAGCPSCVQSPRCGSGNDALDKDGAILLLQFLLES